MWLKVMIITASIGLLIVEGTRSSRSHTHYLRQRTRPRETRGFKPPYLSTAQGFGKRQSPTEDSKEYDKNEKIVLALLEKFPQSIPLEWFLHEIKRNPEFARKLATNAIVGDQDGDVSTVDLFKSERAISLY